MQIREMSLKELESIYELIRQLYCDLSYKEFDDLIYDMRHIEYKMIGLLKRGILITYAGIAVQTNLYHKRHLSVFELITDEKEKNKGYEQEMLEYLDSYAKTAMCERIVFSSGMIREV